MKNILVTGGAGFIGSNLCHVLSARGADITVVDNFHADYGANEFNLADLKLRLVRGDILDQDLMRELCGQADTIFHIAAQCSHVDSMINPFFDLDYNCRGTLSVLEGARHSPRKPVVVYAGTRAMIGQPHEIPAKETTLPNPVDVYGVNKLAAEGYGAVYARVHRIPFVSLRLTNCFGGRHQMRNGKYGILNWFISLALQNKPIKIFGTGEQLRDYLYIDDAIETFVQAAELAERMRDGTQPPSPTVQLAGTSIPFAAFNIGTGKGIPFVEAARSIVKRTGTPLEMVPWPADRKAIETGDFVSDLKASSEVLKWRPKTEFEDGMDRTIAYYQKYLRHYI